MPQFDQMYYDQKWSVWDTWKAYGRNVRTYLITTSSKLVQVVTTQKRRSAVVTTQKRRVNTITGV